MEFLEKAGFVLRVLGIDNAMISSGKESVYLNPRKVLRKTSPRAEGVGSCNFQFECFAYPFRKTGSHVSSFTETVKTPMIKLCSCGTHACHNLSAKVRRNRLFQKENKKPEILRPTCPTLVNEQVPHHVLQDASSWNHGSHELWAFAPCQPLRFHSFCMAGRISQLAEPQSFNDSPNVFLKRK